jgi:pyruvate,water dikinase
VTARNGKVIEKEVPVNRQKAPVLSDDLAAEIVRLGLKLESHFGTFQDIEWAIGIGEAGRKEIFLLQTRPVVGVKVQEKKKVEERIVDQILMKVFH